MSGQDTLQSKTEAFLHEFFVKGQELVRELIEENDRLRTQLAATPELPAVATQPSDSTVQRLMNRVNALESECNEIRRIAGNVQRESGGYRSRLDALEREHYHLAAMYVAGHQFHMASTLDEVLQTIAEILLNFVGVGSFTVFGVDEERQVVFPLMRSDGAVHDVEETPLNADGPLTGATRHGQPWKNGDSMGEAAGVIMHLPLVSGTRVVGVARLESFLPQKNEFLESDSGLLALISEQSGLGLETAWIRAHSKLMPLQRQAIEELVSP